MAAEVAVASIQSASMEQGKRKSSVLESELVLSVEFAQARDYLSIERDSAPDGLTSTVESSSTAGDRAHDPEDQSKLCKCKYFQRATFLEHVIYFCALSVASYVGVLARYYLADLSQWNGVPLFPSIYAEVVGTAIMGFTISHKKLLDSHKALYQATATGLCGSITSFSSWNSEAIEVLLQVGRAPPDNAERIIGWLTVLLLGVGMPIAALLVGKHVANLSPWSDSRLTTEEDEVLLHPRKRYRIAEKVVIVVAWVCSSGLVVYLPLHYRQYDVMFSCVFSFVGTYIRWHLAPLNSITPKFKLGTFLVNVLGSWILGGVAVAMSAYESQLGDVVIGLLKGIGIGFCGCLTTVSTFAVELSTLPLGWSYSYGFSSLLLAHLGLLVIRGTYTWT